MKIFISWSGEKSVSHDVASALHEWLPDVIQGIEPWISTKDIQSGELWSQAVSKQLEKSSYGILSITPLSLQSPWLLFEAGALSKFVDISRVCPYLSKMKQVELTGPLAHLQSRLSDKEGTLKLVQDINKNLETPINDIRLQRTFNKCWPDLEETLHKVNQKGDAHDFSLPKRGDREILEEILTIARGMSLRGVLDNSGGPSSHLDRIADDIDYKRKLKHFMQGLGSDTSSIDSEIEMLESIYRDQRDRYEEYSS